ncbi:hypothetical protein [Enterococcus plantarum]|uniref:hypothetical protein n=1 Tax=Enterococcus plantarum TaxID=1077675 RepID=UPI001A8C0173|nr:hypothetical protein [Enterococcus plantarum]MBO0422318.1 hypothetical protein [Enterococcus plantarum]
MKKNRKSKNKILSWDKRVSFVISIIAVIISIRGWMISEETHKQQLEFKEAYSLDANKFITNSIDYVLVEYAWLIDDIVQEDKKFTKEKYNSHLLKLEANLKTLDQLQIIQFSQDNMATAQFYYQELNSMLIINRNTYKELTNNDEKLFADSQGKDKLLIEVLNNMSKLENLRDDMSKNGTIWEDMRDYLGDFYAEHGQLFEKYEID